MDPDQSTAAGLLLVISSSFAHDLYFRMLNKKASEPNRVLVGRITVIFAVLVAGYFGIHPPDYVAAVVAFVFGLAAVSFFPIIILGVFDKRTNRQGAICGMLAGLGFTTVYIIGNKFMGMPAWCFNISAEGIGAIGMLINFIITLTVSHLTQPPPQDVQRLVDALREPSHAPPAVEVSEETLD